MREVVAKKLKAAFARPFNLKLGESASAFVKIILNRSMALQ